MEQNLQDIQWSVPQWSTLWQKECFKTDRDNIQSALANASAYDNVNTTQAEVDSVRKQLVRPMQGPDDIERSTQLAGKRKQLLGKAQPPDNLMQTVANWATAVCNNDNEPAIRFTADMTPKELMKDPSEAATCLLIMFPGEGKWTKLSNGFRMGVDKLNEMVLGQRNQCKFKIQIEFGNQAGGLKWSVGRWTETIIHEVCIHVTKDLHIIQFWRNGGHWPRADPCGELDHLLFAYAGCSRYNLWMNRARASVTPGFAAEVTGGLVQYTQDLKQADLKAGWDIMKGYHYKTRPNGHSPVFDVAICIAMHFDVDATKLKETDEGLVEMTGASGDVMMELDILVGSLFTAVDRNIAGKEDIYDWANCYRS